MSALSACFSRFFRSPVPVELKTLEDLPLSDLTATAVHILKSSTGFREKKGELKQIFVEMSSVRHQPAEIAKTIEALTREIADPEAVFKCVERLVEMLPVELLEGMLKAKDTDFKEVVELLQDDAADHANLYKDSLPPNLSHRFLAFLSTLSDGAFQVLENAVMILGFSELIKPMESEGQRLTRPQKVLLTITIYGALYTALCGFLGMEYGPAAFAGFLVTMAILSVVYNKIKPPPASLPPGSRNLTEEAKEGRLPKASIESKIYKLIASALSSPKTGMQHPLLIANPGVGKTTALYGFAEACVKGELGEKFKKKQIHFTDGSKIKGANNPDLFDASTSVLEKINNALGSDKNRENTILCIDEIHELWRGTDSSESSLGSQLKNKLSGGTPFPRIIGTTTWKDYHKFMKRDEALSRRFRFIELSGPERGTVLDILRKTLPQGVMDEPGALEHLYDLTEGGVNAAKLILDGCVARLQTSPESQLRKAEERLSELKEKKATLFQDKKHAKVSEKIWKGKEKWKINDEIAKAETALKEAKAERADFAKLCKEWERIQPTLYKRVKRISVVGDKALGLRQRRQVAVLALVEMFAEPEIKKRIIERAKKLGVEQIVSIDLINRIYEEQEVERKSVQKKLKEAGDAKNLFKTSTNSDF